MPKKTARRLAGAVVLSFAANGLLAAGVEACSSSGGSGTPEVDAGDATRPADGSSDASGQMDAVGSPDVTEASLDATGEEAGDVSASDAPPSDASASDAPSSDSAWADATSNEGGGLDAAPDASTTCQVAMGLLGYWPFEEGLGGTTADYSGNNTTAALVNSPAWSNSVPPTPYPNTHSLTFDGSKTYVTMGNPTLLRLTGAFSVAAWFKSSAPLGNYRTLVSKWWSGGTQGTFTLLWSTGSGPQFAVQNSLLAGLAAGTSTSYTDGAWHFAAGTWDGATVRLYIDGHQVSSSTTDASSFSTLSNSPDPFDVGTDDRYAAGTGDRFFPGNIDDVRLYSRALTAAEVGKLFNGACAAL